MRSVVRILDGGMSRELTRLGAELPQPEWSAAALMKAPDKVRRVHDKFVEAGADIITTNSYALVPFHIGEQRFQSDGASLIALSGSLARAAADASTRRHVMVAGSLPPIFGSYEPDRFNPVTVHNYLSVLVDHLAPYIDVWLGETLSLIAEADAVRCAVLNHEHVKPFWISFTLNDDAKALEREPQLRSGETVAEAAEWAAESGATALLFNCSRPEVMTRALTAAQSVLRAHPATKIELGVYANAFEGEQDGESANETLHGIRDDLTLDRYCRFAREWARAGATLIGGCCGIGVNHIRRLVATKHNLIDIVKY